MEVPHASAAGGPLRIPFARNAISNPAIRTNRQWEVSASAGRWHDDGSEKGFLLARQIRILGRTAFSASAFSSRPR